MATDVVRHAFEDEASADLTALGKHLEILRIHRGLSKQGLARTAGTSRQQLWRVMTGKSELTSSLKQRLAGALAVEPTTLASRTSAHADSAHAVYAPPIVPTLTVTDYLIDPHHVATTLRTLPTGEGGVRLKESFLNALEALAAETGRSLPLEFSDLHRRVSAGEL